MLMTKFMLFLEESLMLVYPMSMTKKLSEISPTILLPMEKLFAIFSILKMTVLKYKITHLTFILIMENLKYLSLNSLLNMLNS
jgi:hypothetical protein